MQALLGAGPAATRSAVGTIRSAPSRTTRAAASRRSSLRATAPVAGTLGWLHPRVRPVDGARILVFGSLDGSGVRCEQVDQGGVFTLVVRFDTETQILSFTFETHEVTGKPPAEVLPGLRVITAFHAPNTFRFAWQYGPSDGDVTPIPESFAPVPTADLLALAEAVGVIQQHTATQLVIPPVHEDVLDDIRGIFIAAALLQGQEHTSTLTRFAAPMSWLMDNRLEGGPPNITLGSPLIVKVGGDETPLGYQRLFAPEVEVRIERPSDGSPQMTLTPHRGTGFLMRRKWETTPPPRQASIG